MISPWARYRFVPASRRESWGHGTSRFTPARPGSAWRFTMTAGPIVAATDGSEESLRAVEWAGREAELRGLPLRIVSAAALPPRMSEHQTAAGVATVADTVVSDRNRALAAATQRATAAAPD